MAYLTANHKRLTLEEFITKAILVHGDKYSYILVDYLNSHTKVLIICPIHGPFWQTPTNHLSGKGCRACCNNMLSNTIDFIAKARLVHGDRYLYDKVDYKAARDEICITCRIHGDFWQRGDAHLQGKGCSFCCGGILSNTQDFIIKAKLIHDNEYIYDEVDYLTAKNEVCIICRKHGKFWQTPDNHLHGKGCPFCKSSKGEIEIEKWLKENNIKYIPQYKFKNCKGKTRRLPFDFYLPDYNMCIEFDGRQHYIVVEQFGGLDGFLQTMKHDIIKNNYCQSNKIELLRIPFWDYKTIDAILTNLLSK